jgi:uncharacterized repeat protein (TIGR03803 family)
MLLSPRLTGFLSVGIMCGGLLSDPAPAGKDGMRKLCLRKMVFAIFAFCVGTAIASSAETKFTSLVSFDVTNGSNPYYASLIQGTNGSFYGTTTYGGASEQNCYGNTCGTIFKITPSGTLTTLHEFDFADGGYPEAGLVQTTNGSFYGTAAVGGSTGAGTIFKITPTGSLTTVYEFQNSTDGANPLGALVQARNGVLYGTTSYGGGDPCACGTVFKVTSAGTLTTLHTFVGGGTEGNYPEAGLVQGTDGNFYGTTASGGANGYGTIFKITPAGTLTTLYNFDSTGGANPWAGLVQGADGNLYGTTTYGGTSGSGCTGFGCGTVFKITLTGTLTTLHNFDGTDGGLPTGGLVQATNGAFYGMAGGGGANNGGTIFKITPAGTLTTLHNFDVTDGANPMGGLVQATNGTFYGTTSGGGTDNDGTVLSLSVGLGPFVETLPSSGKVGAAVRILGTKLTSATSVTFNGIPAVFKVASKSLITTTVPTGASTGTVEVTTPQGTLKSNVVFRVTK